MAKKQKYYVVWKGINPGVYNSWEEAKNQITGFEGAQYKSFLSLNEARIMFERGYSFYQKSINKESNTPKKIIQNSISVDAACSGNPGLMEYRGVKTIDKTELFRMGPYKDGTNNIGEFLAIVHGAAMLKKQGWLDTTIYTDSISAMAWVRNKKVKSTLERNELNQELWVLVDRAILWLKNNEIKNPIVKWPTKQWGEIPADFGRK